MFDANEGENPAAPQREERAKRLTDEPLGPSRPRPLRIRRVAEQQVHAAVSDLGQLSDIGLQAVHRRVIELPVARVEDSPGRRLDHERDRIGDRVRDPHELDAKRAELQRRLLGHRFDELGCRPHSVLVELRLDETEREPRGDDRLHLDFAQQVRKSPDVVLVAVRENDSAHTASLEVAHVGQQEIDSQMLVSRERKTGVHHEQLAGRLVHGRVLPDLAETAEGNDPQAVAHRR
jgi:hypothetical protein